jgi:hypothetical protein
VRILLKRAVHRDASSARAVLRRAASSAAEMGRGLSSRHACRGGLLPLSSLVISRRRQDSNGELAEGGELLCDWDIRLHC